MPTIKESSTILLNLNVEEGIDLLMEPMFQSDNPLQNRHGIFFFKNGQDKYRMIHLSRPENTIQPKTSCDNWNPTVSFNLRPDEIGSKEYELNGEQCPDVFDAACARFLRAPIDDANRMDSLLGQKTELNPLEQAMVLATREAMGQDFWKIGWHGNTNFSDMITEGIVDLSEMEIKNKENLIAMLEHQDGWWEEIRQRAALGAGASDTAKIRYLDTNNGTASGNATNPAYVKDFLEDMRTRSNPLLLNWNLRRSPSEWPVYLVNRPIFNALKKYYQSFDNLMAFQYVTDGIPDPNILYCEGFEVHLMADWDYFDYETGQVRTNGLSKNALALFTARENLSGVSNAKSLEGVPGSSLIIEKDPSVKAKGKKYMYAAMSFGFGVAQPQLMTAGFNTNRETWL